MAVVVLFPLRAHTITTNRQTLLILIRQLFPSALRQLCDVQYLLATLEEKSWRLHRRGPFSSDETFLWTNALARRTMTYFQRQLLQHPTPRTRARSVMPKA